MEENCLICYDKCQMDFNTYLTQNPDLKAEVCNLVCEIYKLSNTDLILDLKNYFNFCQLCFDDLSRVDRTFKSLKRLQELLKKDREVLDNRIRESHKRFRVVPAENRVINSVRDEIIRKIADPENVQTPSESFGFATTNEDEPEGTLISNEISQEFEDPFQNFDDLSPILGDVEEEELKFSIINEASVPEIHPTNLPTAVLELLKLPEWIPERISLNDPLIQGFLHQTGQPIPKSKHIRQKHQANMNLPNQNLHQYQNPQSSNPPNQIHNCFFCEKSFSSRMNLFQHKKKYHKDDLYPCSEGSCSDQFPTLKDLNIHQRSVHNIHKYECKYCLEVLGSLDEFYDHKKTQHSNTFFICPVSSCAKEFARKDSFDNHIKEKHGDGTRIPEPIHGRQEHPSMNLPKQKRQQYKTPQSTNPLNQIHNCFFCEKSFSSRMNLFTHKKKYHKDDLYPCSEGSCSDQFPTLKDLNIHQRTIHNIHKYECKYCLEILGSLDEFYTHKKTQHSNTFLICPVSSCAKEFAKKDSFDNHIKVKHGDGSRDPEPTFPCPTEGCEKLFVTEYHLKIHLKAHREREQTYSCPFEGCDRVLTTKGGRRNHYINFHNSTLEELDLQLQLKDEKEASRKATQPKKTLILSKTQKQEQEPKGEKQNESWLCEFCSKIFYNKRYFQIHLRIHPDGERKTFQCTHCSKRFFRKYSLKEHINHIHLKIHNHYCDQCGLGFYNLSQMTTHRRIHFLTIPCRICPKKFSLITNRDKHELSHSSEKTYKCPQCPASYKTLDSIKHHKVTQHTQNPEPFVCQYCGSKFIMRAYLRRHIRKSCKGLKVIQ